jgi:hypothetical protein
MTITSPLSLPSVPGFRRAAFRMINVIGRTQSPFTLERQLQKHQGECWEVDLTLPPIRNRVVVGQWQAFFAAMESGRYSFMLGDPDFTAPLGVATGTPVADSAGSPSVNLARDRVLHVKGLTPGTSGILLRGTRLQLGSGENARLHMLLTDSDSDGSGNAALDIWPALHTDIADEAAVVITNAKGCFELTSNVGWDSDEARVFGFSFAARSIA